MAWCINSSLLTSSLLLLLTIMAAESQEWKDGYRFQEPIENAINYPSKHAAYYKGPGEVTSSPAWDLDGKLHNSNNIIEFESAGSKRNSRSLGYRDDHWDESAQPRRTWNKLSPYAGKYNYGNKYPETYKSPILATTMGSSRGGSMADKSHLGYTPYKSRYNSARSKMRNKPWLRKSGYGRTMNRNTALSSSRFSQLNGLSENRDIVAAIDRIAAKLG